MVEMRPTPIAWNYLTTWFLYDIICVGVDYLVHVLGEAIMGKSASLIRAARLLRMARVLKIRNRLWNAVRRIQSNHFLIVMYIVKNMSIVIVLCHVIACGWHWVGVNFELSHLNWVNTWLKEESDPDVDRSLSFCYFTALNWAITQLGVGAVEIYPRNSAERLYAVFV